MPRAAITTAILTLNLWKERNQQHSLSHRSIISQEQSSRQRCGNSAHANKGTWAYMSALFSCRVDKEVNYYWEKHSLECKVQYSNSVRILYLWQQFTVRKGTIVQFHINVDFRTACQPNNNFVYAFWQQHLTYMVATHILYFPICFS
jgi:hypothetical protein